MARIAVVDDRKDMRESVAQVIALALEDLNIDWQVVPMEPLPEVDDYIGLVEDDGLRVLVLDENLAEVVPEGGEAVKYKGHQIAKFVRDRYRDLPQVIITSIKATDELDDAAELDAIVQRDQFNKNPNVHVERMVRLGESFSRRYEEELADLARLSMKVIEGDADPSDRARLNAIREGKLMTGSAQACMDMRSWLEEADEIKASLERLAALINKDA